VQKGIFTISLDFELHWGGFEKWDLNQYRQYFLNTRMVIPEILSLFEKYEVHATWATVGMLFASSKEELQQFAPKIEPQYRERQLSAYHFISTQGIGKTEAEDPFHYAPTLIDRIRQTPNQEIGTHTFAHVYCNEEGQTPEAFRDDMRSAVAIAKKSGIELKSLVFPRNQFNDGYLQICCELGIRAVRSNPAIWFWNIDSTQAESFWKRFNRGLDAYWPSGKRNSYTVKSIDNRPGLPVCIPASRLLRPYNPKEFFLNSMKINKVRGEIERAAKSNECYHLWWHPHNFGNYPEQSIQHLEMILKQFAGCRNKWGMVSMNMDELTTLVRNGK
jgi:peptidoglycan/xylan/chitin deacetylase (PgdA/CDA1 family)